MIEFEDFKKIEMAIGEVKEIEQIIGSDKLYKMKVDFETELRTIVAGMVKFYKPEEIKGKKLVFLLNLKPRTLFGVESQGMMVNVLHAGKPIFLMPEQDVPAGTRVV